MSLKKTILKVASWAAKILPTPIKKFLYKQPVLARMIRRSLNAAVPEGLSETTIAAGPTQGLKMFLNLKSEKDYWLGTYETDLQAAAAKLIQSGAVVFDIGANIGFISLLAAQLSGAAGKIFSFEALPANVERLKTNVSINNLDSRITVIHAAVMDTDHPVTFLMHASGAMGKALGSAGRDEQYSGRITVPGLAIDTFIYDHNHPAPDLIKMDIEGGEGASLAGMQRLLSEQKTLFLVELHGEQAAREVWEHFLQNKYEIYTMTQPFSHITHIDDLDWKAYIIAAPAHSTDSLT